MPRKRFDVSPDKGDWKLTRGGKTIRTFDTKEPAVREGAKQARRETGNSQLVVHRKDGTIQDERTYKKDPYPPKG